MNEITVVSYWNPPIYKKDARGADLVVQRDVLWHVIPGTVYLHEGADHSISSIDDDHEVLRRLPGLPTPFNCTGIHIYTAPEKWNADTIQKVGLTIVGMTNRYRERFRPESLLWLPRFYQPLPRQ